MDQDSLTSRASDQPSVEVFPGVSRATMSYNEETMLCVMTFDAGATVPMHNHVAAQNGLVLDGEIEFRTVRNGEELRFLLRSGDGYLFPSNQPHGARALARTRVVECFTPMRPEYVDGSSS